MSGFIFPEQINKSLNSTEKELQKLMTSKAQSYSVLALKNYLAAFPVSQLIVMKVMMKEMKKLSGNELENFYNRFIDVILILAEEFRINKDDTVKGDKIDKYAKSIVRQQIKNSRLKKALRIFDSLFSE